MQLATFVKIFHCKQFDMVLESKLLLLTTYSVTIMFTIAKWFKITTNDSHVFHNIVFIYVKSQPTPSPTLPLIK